MLSWQVSGVKITICAMLVGFYYQEATLQSDPLTEVCDIGWFGPKCMYKCRCDNASCDKTGVCGQDVLCMTGWFGDMCQYVDLAYKTTAAIELTDGDDTTCSGDSGLSEVTITSQNQYLFTWMRLVFNTKVKRSVEVLFKQSESKFVKCHNQEPYSESLIVNMHCFVNEPVQTVIVNGSLSDLCSLYINGGRQVSLKQTTSQSPPYPEPPNTSKYPASNAVDGNTDPDFYQGLTCSKTEATANETVSWSIRLLQQQNVDKYIIYFPINSSIYTHGIAISGYDVNHATLFNVTVKGSELTPEFTLLKRTFNVIDICIKSSAPVLELCEVEVYGDSACDIGKFGFDCNRTCYCREGKSCFASTGECHLGCEPGLEGDTCLPCRAGKYGQGCQSNCSQFCAMDDHVHTLCHNVNGTCLRGCLMGYTPPLCASTCEPGTYGASCSSVCNVACAKLDNETVTNCDFVTGTCSQGCDAGYMGEQCNITCAPETYGLGCGQQCGANCKKETDSMQNSCSDLNGVCLHGCDSGYLGAFCTESCPNGMYGKECKHKCPSKCAVGLDKAMTQCRPTNGSCLYGCTDGSSGPYCDIGNLSPSSSDTLSHGWNNLFIMTLFAPVGFAFCVKFCVMAKKKTNILEPLEETDSLSTTTV